MEISIPNKTDGKSNDQNTLPVFDILLSPSVKKWMKRNIILTENRKERCKNMAKK